jgi:TIR domain
LPFIVESLNLVCSYFTFELYPHELHIGNGDITPETYDELNLDYHDDDTNFFMIFTDKQYYNNYFFSPEGRIFITSFFAWEYLTKLSKNNGAVFFIADVLALGIDATFRHTLNDSAKPECIYDFLENKKDVDSSMRASSICIECNERIKKRLNNKTDCSVFEDIKAILNELGNASKWDEDLISYWEKRRASNAIRRDKKRVFISYSHADSEWLQRVKVHLKPLERNSIIEIWEDTRIKTGDNWKNEIERALSESESAILLVSADFLASDFIIENELPQLLKIAKTKGTRIFQIIISPCCFDETERLSQFQAVNSASNTLIEMSRGDQERLLLQLAKSIISHA